tara:strand:+ start:34 stop:528 length:495 start_codon:yes stop_codon:yes gene_type:complete
MFNFKSSGKSITSKKYNKKEDLESQILPIGIKTPLEPGNDKSELFKLHVDPLEQLADNLRNLVQTNHGERLGRFTYGCNLKSILFDRNSSIGGEYEKAAIENINQQVKKHIPVITIENIDINPEEKRENFDRTSLAKVIIKIGFSVPALRRMNNSIEVILYNGG